MESVLLDVDGHRRSPATMPGYHAKSGWTGGRGSSLTHGSRSVGGSRSADCYA